MIAIVETALLFVAGYLGIGVVVSILFVIFGVSRIDAAAEESSPFFRPVIFLGCVLLWPFIVLRLLSFRKINQQPEEKK
ncbi:MAG: hypothetical protein AAGB02_01755 [Pseudomonadota bacterium]